MKVICNHRGEYCYELGCPHAIPHTALEESEWSAGWDCTSSATCQEYGYRVQCVEWDAEELDND